MKRSYGRDSKGLWYEEHALLWGKDDPSGFNLFILARPGGYFEIIESKHRRVLYRSRVLENAIERARNLLSRWSLSGGSTRGGHAAAARGGDPRLQAVLSYRKSRLPRRDPSRKGLWGLAKRAHKKVSDFSPRALAKGIRVEMEHTEQRAVARRIAMDHLTEDPRYYDKLARMERGGYGRDPGRKKSKTTRKTKSKTRAKPKTRAKRKSASSPRKRGRTPKSEGAHCSGAPILARKARKVEPPHTCPSATKVQSLVFERWCWTLARAKSWAQRHGYKTEVDTSERYYRFRQLPPKTYKPVGTVPFMRGLNAIMGCTRIAKKRKKS